MKKHRNIPIFIPHLGCQNNCVFCNQKSITQTGTPAAAEHDGCAAPFIPYIPNDGNDGIETEIAFFGGSFTGIPAGEQTAYLQTANEYIKQGLASGIRLSTRPDYISRDILNRLKMYNVRNIELGIQSMFDDVLEANKRGHTVRDTIKACSLIKEYGFELTGQMMVGMYGSDREKDAETALRTVELGIDSARIYPTVVLKDTALYSLWEMGAYKELTLDDAVEITAETKKIFISNDINVIRVGLCATEFFMNPDEYIGPYHPAFGELVDNRIILDGLIEEIKNNTSEYIEIKVKKEDISKYVGHKRQNITTLKKIFPEKTIKFVKIKEISDLLC